MSVATELSRSYQELNGPGKTLSDIDFRFAPFKKGTWRTYTPLDGLAQNNVGKIDQTPDRVMWFETGSGVSRYDGERFIRSAVSDELAGIRISAIYADPAGTLWFLTQLKGVFVTL